MPPRSVIRILAGLAAMAVLAAACESDGGSAGADTTAAAPTTTSTVAPAPTSTVAPATTTTTMTSGEAVKLVAPVVRLPTTGEVIYFVLTDRFENADPDNDTGGLGSGSGEADVLRHGYLPTDPGFYHGGDVAGLERRLDYFEGLGVSAIWVTPPFTNRAVQGNGSIAGSSAGYHGYWQVDYTTIDPHLGTNAEMQAMIEAAHSRGMRVYFDAVLNHTGDVITFVEDSVAYRSKDRYPYTDANGEPFDDRDYVGGSDFPELDPGTSFAYTPAFATDGDAAVKGPDWLNDPIYYHNRGNSTFDGENSLYGDFFGLDDLFTEHPDVVQGMTHVYEDVIAEFGVDGFRVDTVKHVNDEFWAAFVPAIEEAARRLGDEDLFLFGEVFSPAPLLRSHYTTNGPFPSVLDFGFSDAVIAYVADGVSAQVLVDLFADDDWYTDADSNASMLVKFAGNHDVGRLGNFVRRANRDADDAELLRRMELAMELMFTTRGIPLIYYGDEQGFVGDGGDKAARQDMFPSRVDAYNDDDLIGTDATTADANFDVTHPLYVRIGELAGLRRDHPTLETGAHISRPVAADDAVYAFSRIDRNEQIEYVVVANNATETRTVTLELDSRATGFSGVYPAQATEAVSDDAGRLEVSVPGLSTVAYRADTPLPPSPAAPGIEIISPEPEATVSFERFRIEAALDDGRYSEVTFAISVNGGDFEIIGTDDAPPYRVFWDRTQLPAGTRVEVTATVDDLAGHRAAATSTFTLA